jgi:hypothetical protein
VFTEFFYLLRAYGVPVTVTEWLTFMQALAGGLVAASLNDFYAVGRAVLDDPAAAGAGWPALLERLPEPEALPDWQPPS